MRLPSPAGVCAILIYYHPIFLEHDTGRHPESSTKLLPSVVYIQSLAHDSRFRLINDWSPASLTQLHRVHTPAHVRHVHDFAVAGGGNLDADTVVCPRSYHVALMAAGAVCDAVARVMSGKDPTAFCLLRPPGHHALADQAMGFCLFNSIAVGARAATAEFNVERVLIVDWDVHHGNGTQAIFYEAADVGFFSIHRQSFYPYTGFADETGCGAGQGTTQNLPIQFGMPRAEQFKKFETELNAFADLIQPQLIMISAGFDAHANDPVGSLGWQTEDFTRLTNVVQQIAMNHTGGKIVSVLEGGYDPTTLVACVEQHLIAMCQHAT